MKQERNAVLSLEVAKKMFEGDDSQLKQLALDTYPELGKKSAEDRFLELFNGCMVEKPKDGNSMFYHRNGDWYFDYDFKNGYFWCQYDRVWSVFYSEYGYSYQQIKDLIAGMLVQHLNLKGVNL